MTRHQLAARQRAAAYDRQLREIRTEIAIVDLQLAWTYVQQFWYSGGSWLTTAAATAFIATKVF